MEGRTTIHESTIRRWLGVLGWKHDQFRSGVYMDGHERADVVEYRQTFLEKMESYERWMPSYDGVDMNRVDPLLESDARLHVLVTHDELIFYANDSQHHGWHPVGEQPLRKKGRGRSLHVSEFLTETIGRLRLTEAQQHAFPGLVAEACVIIEPGTNHDGWWTAEQLIQQVVERAIPIFEATHPGAVAVFAFDQSTCHGAFAADALVASRMALRPGGKQPRMRSTIFNGSQQDMVLPDGTPKGLRLVLQERGLWREGLLADCEHCKSGNVDAERRDCCARRIMVLQPDFLSQRPLLQEVIEERGHQVIFYPKFHCELNFIEMYWGAVKRYARSHCDYTWRGLKAVLPAALDSVSQTTIRRFARKSWRYMDAYRSGLRGRAAEHAVKKYRSHRRIPISVFSGMA